MNVMLIAGARPHFMKIASIVAVIHHVQREIMKRFDPVLLREDLKKVQALRRGHNDNTSKSVKVFP